MRFRDIRGRICAELACVNITAVWITAAICAALGVVSFSWSGMSRVPYVYAPRAFWVGLFFLLFWALIGASLALVLFSGKGAYRQYPCLLFVCALLLSYAWQPVVYRGASFFLGALLCAVCAVCLFFLSSVIRKRFFLSAAGAFLGALWLLYVLYYTIALAFLNG